MNALSVEIKGTSIGGRCLLGEINFDCFIGTITVLVGENGAGKSVLLRAIAGLQKGCVGRMNVCGKEFLIRGEPLKAGRGPWPTLTMVLQNGALWPTLTIKEQIELPQRLRGAVIPGALFDEIVDAFELDFLLSRRPLTLSGGERQRAALARAFALQPTVVLLDEPSAALDVRQIQKFELFLRNFAAKGGCLLTATHSVGLVRHLADKCLFLARGKILADAPLADLEVSAHPEFSAFWKVMAG